MAYDRFVYWQTTKPSRDEIVQALRDFLGELGKVEVTDRVYVDLPGKPSNAFNASCRDDQRWFEVYITDESIDVITRQQDRITNAIATEFAELCAQYWQGQRDFEK